MENLIKRDMALKRSGIVILDNSDSEASKVFSANDIKILLIVPKYNFSKEKFYHYTFPIGLGYVSAILKKSGYKVDCLNLNHLYGEVKELMKEALNKENYDFVCTGGNDFIFHTVKTMIDVVKGHSSKPKFILAGHILTHEPELMLEELKPDFGIISEGEDTILELINCVKTNNDLREVAGVIYYNDSELVRTKKRVPIKNLDSIPFPDYEGFGFDEYLEYIPCNLNYFNNTVDLPRTYAFLGSRGCAFNCTFCWHSENYRWRSIDNIMQEMRHVVKRYKINNLNIVDDCFSIKQERVYEFCEKIKELSDEVGWPIKWTCQILVHTVDKKLLHIMKDAGCEIISYGFESFSPIILRSMMKPITPQQIDKAFHATLQAKIGIQAHFIFGDTNETVETAKQTLEYWINNANGQIGLGFIQPYPGSIMYQRCIEKGVINDKLDYIKSQMDPHNCINMTNNISDGELMRFRTGMLIAFSRYVKFVRPISIEKTKKNLYAVKVRCPFCKEKIIYKNCYIGNKLTFGFNLVCRSCYMRFFAVSLLQKIGYRYYSKTRAIRTYYKKLLRLNRKEGI